MIFISVKRLPWQELLRVVRGKISSRRECSVVSPIFATASPVVASGDKNNLHWHSPFLQFFSFSTMSKTFLCSSLNSDMSSERRAADIPNNLTWKIKQIFSWKTRISKFLPLSLTDLPEMAWKTSKEELYALLLAETRSCGISCTPLLLSPLATRASPSS